MRRFFSSFAYSVAIFCAIFLFCFSCTLPTYLEFSTSNCHNELALPVAFSATDSDKTIPLAINLSNYSSSSICSFNKSSVSFSDSVIEGYYIKATSVDPPLVVIPVILKDSSKATSDLKLVNIKFLYNDIVYDYPGNVYTSSPKSTYTNKDQIMLNRETIPFASVVGSVVYTSGVYINIGLAPGEVGYFVIGLSSTGASKIENSVARAPFKSEADFDASKLNSEKYEAVTLSLSATLSVSSKIYKQPLANLVTTSVASTSDGSLTFEVKNNSDTTAQIVTRRDKSFSALCIYAKDGEKIIPKFFRFLQFDSSQFSDPKAFGKLNASESLKLTINDLPYNSVDATFCSLYLFFEDRL